MPRLNGFPGGAGMSNGPTIGFGPADERHAHAPTDQCPAAHIPAAVGFYAALAHRAAQHGLG